MTRVPQLVALLLLVAACPGKEIDMLEPATDDNDHGRSALLDAVAAHTDRPVSPDNFAEFAATIDELRPRFNEEVSELANLYLSFAGLRVMTEIADRPRDEQLDALALTVFPVAFGLEPEPGEAPRDYLLRLCGEDQPLECKEYVPEGWPVVLSAKVRRTVKNRAREALSSCTICANQQTYEDILARFSDAVAEEDAFAAEHEDDYLPSRWPMAAPHAAEWSDPPLFSLLGGVAAFEGEPLSPGSWSRPLSARRDGRDVLGVHLTPGNDVEALRAIARDAKKAGFDQLALQVRDHQYPYTPREYRIALRGRAPRIDVRDIDTIQILARALDAHAANHDRPPRL